jgi:hypothetical protein
MRDWASHSRWVQVSFHVSRGSRRRATASPGRRFRISMFFAVLHGPREDPDHHPGRSASVSRSSVMSVRWGFGMLTASCRCITLYASSASLCPCARYQWSARDDARALSLGRRGSWESVVGRTRPRRTVRPCGRVCCVFSSWSAALAPKAFHCSEHPLLLGRWNSQNLIIL